MEFFTMEHFEIMADMMEEVSEELADLPEGVDPADWLSFKADTADSNPWA